MGVTIMVRKETVLVILLLAVIIVGCGPTNTSRKTTGGIGLGALAGGLITGDVEGAVAGAAVGGVAGYAIGTDQDRHAEKSAMERERLAIERERNMLAKASITNNPDTAYRPESRNDLVGTVWRVISIEGEQPFPEYHSVVSTFTTNSKLTTMLIQADGSAQTVVETYQIVDDVMVVTGVENGKKYVVNGKYNIQGNQFVYVTPTYRVVTERVD